MRWLVALGCAALVLAAAGTAEAKRARRLAVVEVRSGADGASDLGLRLALILRRATSLEIIDGDDARQMLGAQVDEALARCAGEAPCVAKVGARLKADQVLLVGVSSLGDLIVALQLIDVRTGKVQARVAESLPEHSEPDDNTLEGYLRRLLPKSDFLRYGTIRVSTDVAGAEVEIGGVGRGRTPIEPVVVEAPARYDVRVRKPGYSDFRLEIDVPPDAVVEVKPRLEKRVAAATPWYGKWWVWAIAGTVVGGVVVTGVVMSQDSPTSAPVVLDPWPVP
jgi:hypothetical protein